MLARHKDCVACPTRECLGDERTVPGGYATCRYGLVYAPIDDDRLVVGIVGANLSNPTPKARQRFQSERERHVRIESLLRAVAAVRNAAPGLVADIELQRRLAIEQLKSDPELISAVGEILRRDLEDNFSQSHDFLQLVKVIRGHAEVLLLRKHPNLSPEAAAEIEPTEGSIYFATTLMASKVDSLVFLNEINRAFGDLRKFEIHPLVLKYLRIYEWQARQKNLKLSLLGQCFAVCYYNPEAIIAIVQGFLDNMVKYAPAGSRGDITLTEAEEDVEVTFSSLGPKIGDDELEKIFLPRFRAIAAKQLEPSGQGVGLGIVRELSDVLDLNVRVEQSSDESPKFPERFETTFSFRLRKV